MNKIKSLLSQGKFDEMESQRVSYFINIIIIVTTILLLLLGISKILLPPFKSEVAWILWTLAGIISLIYLIFRKSKSRFVGLTYIVSIWIAASILAWTNEGVKDIAIFSYIICIIIAISLSSYLLAVIIGALSLISVWGLVYAGQNHFLIPSPDTEINYAVDFTALLIVIITLLFLYRNSYLLLVSRIKRELNDKLDAEKSLRERESVIGSISNNLTSGMIYQVVRKPDGSSHFTYLSNSVMQLYGITPEEGMANANLIYSRVHKDDIEFLKKAENEAIEYLKVFRAEVRIMGPSGAIRWSSLISTPRLMEDGSVCFDGIDFDITDRMILLEELKESERKSRAIFDSSYGLVGLLNTEGIVLDINKTALDFTGVQLTEVKGKPFWETPWWSHSAEIQNQIREAIMQASKGELVKGETTHIDKDGGLHIIEFTLKPVFDEKGHVSFLIPEGRDITESKKATEILKEDKERFRTLSSIGTEGLMIHKDGIIIDANQTFANLTGYSSPDELVGKLCFNFVPFTPESKKTVIDHFNNNSDETYDIELISPGGAIVPVETRGIEINYMGMEARLVYLRDITSRRRAEEEIQYQSRLQEMLINMATIFINLPVEEVNSVMHVSLGELAEVVDADSIIIFHYDFREFIISAVNEWTREGIKPIIGFFEGLPMKSIPDWDLESHLQGEPIYISDTQSVPQGELRQIFERFSAKSFLAVPMIGHGECIGFVGISWIRNYHSFKKDEMRILKVFALMLVNLQMRKKTDEALMKSEEKYRELVENINDVVFTLDSDGIITYISPRVSHLYNYQPEELIGRSIVEIVHPDDLEDLRKRFYSKAESDHLPLEFRYINRSGLTGWAQISSRPIIEFGRMTGVLGLFSDITKRKKDEEAVRKLSLAVEQSPASIVITNLAGEIEYVNPRFTQVTGYVPVEVIGRNSNILKSGRTPREIYHELWSQISAGKEWKGEFYNRKKNGEFFWEAASISPILNDKGEITHYLAVKEDITDKKEATRRIFDVIIETEERERLRYSHELHDGLGPILSTINLYLQMLAEKTEADQKETIISRASSCINEAIQTIKDISYNLSPNVLSNFGIVSGINNFINRLNETEKSYFDFYSNVDELRFEKNIEITIYRIVTELLNNTIKYSGASQTEVKLNYSDKDSSLTLEYVENGCGFDLNAVLSSRKGLGLSNIYQRVTTLNGKINIETGEGKGVRVYIELPV